jgi:ParB family transcriptional regulator, chromosome partitioning protein
VTTKPALGRGLAALIPGAASPERGSLEVDVELLDASRQQPRRRFEEAGLDELSASIRESGVLQPILVSREGERYRIIAGERRLRAAKRAGLKRVPILVKEAVADRDRLLLALVENVQRRDLTPLEEAEAFHQLKEQFGLTQEDVATRVGKDRATVANALRLLKLPAAIRDAVDDGRLTAGHARPLLTLASAADQEALAKEAIARGYTVRRVEERAAELAGERKKKRGERKGDPETRDAERRLSRALGTKVEIRRRRKGGEVRIAFYSEEELIGLFERLSSRDDT